MRWFCLFLTATAYLMPHNYKGCEQHLGFFSFGYHFLYESS